MSGSLHASQFGHILFITACQSLIHCSCIHLFHFHISLLWSRSWTITSLISGFGIWNFEDIHFWTRKNMFTITSLEMKKISNFITRFLCRGTHISQVLYSLPKLHELIWVWCSSKWRYSSYPKFILEIEHCQLVKAWDSFSCQMLTLKETNFSLDLFSCIYYLRCQKEGVAQVMGSFFYFYFFWVKSKFMEWWSLDCLLSAVCESLSEMHETWNLHMSQPLKSLSKEWIFDLLSLSRPGSSLAHCSILACQSSSKGPQVIRSFIIKMVWSLLVGA